ncbi:MAG TPA: hypothetical protein VL624_21320 [Caldimonas sp.]|jgi:hypothetical protein|nr:hypothetical protein [Caldimonas sp.]
MKLILRAFAAVHAAFAAAFAVLSLLLLAVAARTSWVAVSGGSFDAPVAVQLIEAMGLVAVAVVSLQVAQTIAEEEVVREAHVSAPTRVRRFLSRFIVVVAVALAIEGLVATVKALHEDMTLLPDAASAVAGVAALLAAWGIFVRLNRSAEDIEPEAMQQAKDEDRKLG